MGIHIIMSPFFCSGSFSSLGFLRYLVIDEADKLLDYHFNQWLPKLLATVSRDKAAPKGCGFRGTSLEETLEGLCLHPERFQLMRHCNTVRMGLIEEG